MNKAEAERMAPYPKSGKWTMTRNQVGAVVKNRKMVKNSDQYMNNNNDNERGGPTRH